MAGAVPTTVALSARRAAKVQWRARAVIGSAPAARQVAVARVDDDGALAAQVANRDAALADARQRAVAAILHVPRGAADGGDAVAAARAEAPVIVAAPQLPRRAPGRSGRGTCGARAGALQLGAAQDQFGH